jgi:hypothetical protein
LGLYFFKSILSPAAIGKTLAKPPTKYATTFNVACVTRPDELDCLDYQGQLEGVDQPRLRCQRRNGQAAVEHETSHPSQENHPLDKACGAPAEAASATGKNWCRPASLASEARLT